MVPGENLEVCFELIQDVFSEEFPEVDVHFDWMQRDSGVFTVKCKKPGQIFHHMLNRQRIAVDMSLAELSKKLKRTTVEDLKAIEEGRVQPTVAQFFTIIDALGYDAFVSVRRRANL